MTEPRSNERGIAMIIALFMMLAMSMIGASLMFVSQSETLSSQNYRLMSQARYGAESGIHSSVNYLLNTYTPPTTTAELANYTMTTSPVKYNNAAVVLSSTAASSNYPVAAIKTAFAAASHGTLDVKNGLVSYTATATLKSMRQITDLYSGVPVTIQTWEITGDGTVGGATAAQVEVSAVVERQTSPIYPYAAFATYNGCDALSFAGGATTNSYDSSAALVGGLPVLSDSWGNVGTNGNLSANGNSTSIHGTLSTPRTGVGACTANNVTAATISGFAAVSNGLSPLSQSVDFPTPAALNPLPPTTSDDFKKTTGCPAGQPYCAPSTNGATFTPPSGSTVTLGNVGINAGAVLHLNAGTYVLNSFSMNGNASIVVDSGPVTIKVAGVGQSTPVTITGNGISNLTYNPANLEFIYGGTGEIKLSGGDTTAALFYAPKATASISGGADLYGAIVVSKITETGGASIHYDRRLQTSGVTAGNYMMSAFTWKSY